MANVDNISAQGFNPVLAVSNVFNGLLESYRMSREFQATFDELDRLSDEDLADIGINRYDITRIAHDAVYGDGVSAL